jgi:arsenate reductase
VCEREIFKNRFTVEELRSLIQRIGVKPIELVSRRSRPFQDLGLADRDLNDEELLKLMVQHPALIRRPLMVRGNRGVIGFDQNGLSELLRDA